MKQIDAKTRQLLYAYVDKELSDEARHHFEARLADEPWLATALNEERQLRARLQAHVRRHHAPPSLRDRVKQTLSLHTQPPTSSQADAPTSSGASSDNDQKPSWWQRIGLWWRTPLPLQPAFLLSYTLFWFVILGSVIVATRPALSQVATGTQPTENHSVFRQLAGKHGVYFAIDAPLDVRGTKREIIEWFQPRVPSSTSISIPTLDGFRLEGARLGEFHHQGTVHLLYRRADELISLTLFLPRDTDFPQNSWLEVENRAFFVGDDGTRHAILWRHADTGYALVGDPTLTQEELLPIATEASKQLP